MNLTEGQLLFRLQDFHGAEQEALGIGDYEFAQESADIACALRELLQARRTIEELTAVVGQRNGECVRLHSLLEAAEKRIAEQNFENRLLANADRDIKALRQRIAELESRTVTLPPRAPENLAACLDGYDKWVIATTFRDTWNACLSEVMRMNAAGIGVKGE
ncbi:TPA: hypothetical protein ACJT77_004790 [Citrobacter freundii]